jgi:hypothetical protein
VRLEGLGQLKIPMTPGIETATFSVAAWCLNQLRFFHLYSLQFLSYENICLKLITILENPPPTRNTQTSQWASVCKLRWDEIFIHPVKPESFSSCLTNNTLYLHYKAQPVNAV